MMTKRLALKALDQGRNLLTQRTLLSLTASLLLGTSVFAQNQNDGASANTNTAPATSKQVVVPSLQGLKFVSGVSQVEKSGALITGVNTSAVKMLGPEFTSSMQVYLGKPLTFDALNEITRAVVTYFRAHNHPLVDVVAPAQDVENGVVQIAVTEYKVGEVLVQGNNWFSDNIISAPVTLHHGDTVDSQKLINELDATNSNPFRRVNLVYRPSGQPGYTDLVLETQDRFPLRVFTGFDNNGTPTTGRNRWELGLTWGNALWHDQQLSYQFSSSPSFFTGNGKFGSSFQGHSLSWNIPVVGRDSIVVSGGYQRAVPNIGADFGLVGKSGEAGIHYNHPLTRTGSLIQTLQVGYDFKTTNNNLLFGGTQVSATNAEIDEFPLTYAANMTDKWGSSELTTSLVFSPGGITPDNVSRAFQPGAGQSGRPLASAHYFYWRTDATRLTKLPLGAIWALRLIGQTSTANLLYTEQLAAGGEEILRGYDPNSLLGDRGVIISNELRSPAFRNKHSEALSWLGSVQMLGFWDYGHLSAEHPQADSINKVSASSLGVGMHYNLRSNVTAKMSYGVQLQALPGIGYTGHLLSFALMTSY